MRRAVIVAALLGLVSTVAWVVVNICAVERALEPEQHAASEPEGLPQTWADARGHVVVAIWPLRWLELDAADAPGARRIISRDFADGLLEVPEVQQVPVDEATSKAWGVEERELFEVARANVRRMKWALDKLDGGVFAYSAASPTAFLTWPETFANLPIAGQRLIGFTHEKGLLGDSASDESIATLLALLEADARIVAVDGEPMPLELSGRVLSYTADRWVEWAPPPSHAERYQQLRAAADEIELARLGSDAGR